MATPVQQQPAATKSAAYLPPAFHRWPSHSQLASAVRDLGPHVGQAPATADTVQPPLWQTGKSVSCMFE